MLVEFSGLLLLDKLEAVGRENAVTAVVFRLLLEDAVVDVSD